MSQNKKCMTPPMLCSGIFTLIAPFSISTSIVYSVDAIESLRELKKDGIDVYTRYYQPHGLATTDYTTDVNLNASIVTLRAGDGSLIEVPDTYISSYPGASGISHTRYIVTADLGLVPDYLDIAYITSDIKDVLTKNLGIVGDVFLSEGPVTTQLTYEQHIANERQRRANVVIYESKDEQIARLTAEVDAIRKQNEQLEQILADMQPTV